MWTRGTSGESGRNLAICDGPNVVAIVKGDGYPIGKGNGPRSDAVANLIAAAPDLLAAGRTFLAELDSGSDFEAWERAKAGLRAAVAAATADTFGATMAIELAKRTNGLAAWNHTAQERADIIRARRNGAGLRITFRDGSAAFIPAGTADVRTVA